ncbi:hypothetical protein GGF32_003812 [Allomyces javanicus]|nr:hypothetical protein GGF32_003812 [Allomyces javanicus]
MLLRIHNGQVVVVTPTFCKHSEVIQCMTEDCPDVCETTTWTLSETTIDEWDVANKLVDAIDAAGANVNDKVHDVERKALEPYGPSQYHRILGVLEIGDFFDMPRVVFVASKVMAEILDTMTDVQLLEFVDCLH